MASKYIIEQFGRKDDYPQNVNVKIVVPQDESPTISPQDIYDYLQELVYEKASLVYDQAEVDERLCRLEMGKFLPGDAEEPLITSDYRSHNKFFMVDKSIFYIGSQNLYPGAITDESPIELNEFGFLVDDATLAEEVENDYWNPIWSTSGKLGQHLFQPAHISPSKGCHNGDVVDGYLPALSDSDSDGLPNWFEVGCSNVASCDELFDSNTQDYRDSDMDGTPDYLDVDSDDDGLFDWAEARVLNLSMYSTVIYSGISCTFYVVSRALESDLRLESDDFPSNLSAHFSTSSA